MEKNEFVIDLKNEIKKYDEIFKKELQEYLESLLMLEINIVNEQTYSKEKLELLKEIEIFRRIIKYNIYGYAKKTLVTIDDKINIRGYYSEKHPILIGTYNNKWLFDSNFEDEKTEFAIYQAKKQTEILTEDKIIFQELSQKTYETLKKEYGPFETENEEEIQLIKNNPYINIYRKTKNI